MLSDVKKVGTNQISLRLMSQHRLFLVLHISPFSHPKRSRPPAVTENQSGDSILIHTELFDPNPRI